MSKYWKPIAPRVASFILAATIVLFCPPSEAAHAQDRPIVITLDEAVQIALIRNLEIQNARLDRDMIQSQISEGYSELYPLIDLSSSYTRNILTTNPFAGSAAGGLFSSLGLVDWLAFNEDARTDGDPETEPIPVEDYFDMKEQGLIDSGIQVEVDTNPFAVPNQYRTGLAITQKLFDARVLFGAKGAKKWLPPYTDASILRQEQLLIDDVKRIFYQTRLVEERAQVQRLSVERSRKTKDELTRQVAQGVLPKFQRLSAEVDLANLETELVVVTNQVEASMDALKLLLGIDPEDQIILRGDLAEGRLVPFIPIPIEEAVSIALYSRPDLEQLRIQIEIDKVQLNVINAEYYPDLSAFMNLGYIGNVPDNRQVIMQDGDDPFAYTATTLGYFSPAYWNWDMNAGFRLNWNLFNGFSTTERVQQRKITIQKAELSREYLFTSIRTEVQKSMRDVAAAQQRMASQEQNVDNADLNYSFVDARLREGVASPIELREASNQLDQSRLNFLQAVHDYVVAISSYETALGAPTNELIESAATDTE